MYVTEHKLPPSLVTFGLLERQSQGNLLFGPGVYEFEVTAEVSNVKDEEPTIIKDVFQITVDENMKNVMQKQPDGEYLYPLPIESIN